VTRIRHVHLLALLIAAALLAGCGATAEDPQNDPIATEPATFGTATFDASTWR
jgi:outer membrane biogenesis lipoprotein LolB